MCHGYYIIYARWTRTTTSSQNTPPSTMLALDAVDDSAQGAARMEKAGGVHLTRICLRPSRAEGVDPSARSAELS